MDRQLKNSVIFGGTGFVGTFFARYLVEEHGFKKVYLYDNEPIESKVFEFRKKMIDSYPEIEVIAGNVLNLPIEK